MPTPCAGSWWRPGHRGRRAGSGRQVLQEIVRKVLLTYWNTVAFHVLYARANDWTPADGGPPVDRAAGPGPLAGLEPEPAGARRDRGAARRSTPSAPVSCSAASSTTSPTGTSDGPAGASGRATGPRSSRCTRRWTCSPGCSRRSSRSSPSGSGRTSTGVRPVGARLGPPGGVAVVRRGPDRRRPRGGQQRWPGGSSSSAGRPGRRRRSRPVSRCVAPSSRRPLGPD